MEVDRLSEEGEAETTRCPSCAYETVQALQLEVARLLPGLSRLSPTRPPMPGGPPICHSLATRLLSLPVLLSSGLCPRAVRSICHTLYACLGVIVTVKGCNRAGRGDWSRWIRSGRGATLTTTVPWSQRPFATHRLKDELG